MSGPNGPKTGDALSAYPSGHHPAVLASHASRTAQNSAMHLLPHLKAGMRILDVGCGPGTISASLAQIVGETGEVIGIDPSEEVISVASQGNSQANLSFQVGDGASLRFEDHSFDVVHAHQVLQHSTEVVTILREMRRVVKKPGGIISLREVDMGSVTLYPSLPTLQKDFVNLYPKIASSKGADPHVGRKLHVKLREAAFTSEQVEITAGTMLYGANNPAEAKWWGESWAQRISDSESGLYKTAIEEKLATKEELRGIADGWLEWAASEDAWFAVLNGQAICKL